MTYDSTGKPLTTVAGQAPGPTDVAFKLGATVADARGTITGSASDAAVNCSYSFTATRRSGS